MNIERYSRQSDIIDKEGQKKLIASKVLVIGSGGLGSAALYYLTAAGIGSIGIVDKDKLELSNLNRQILHKESSIGADKSKSAFNSLKEFNSETELKYYSCNLTDPLADELFPEYDVIVNCVDNYETRKIVSNKAVKHNKILIEAGIEMMYGFIQIIIPGKSACFNCLESETQNIQRQVIGAAAGIIGSMQSLELIKILTGLWDDSYSYISIDFNNYQVDRVYLPPTKDCCGSILK
ncbi:MAG: HesA/MoeB/ThiF family protein [Spirochaetaceae bacterium]